MSQKATETNVEISVRKERASDRAGIQSLLDAHMLSDGTWPPPYARSQGNLPDWLGELSTLGRWVALAGAREMVGHVGVSPVDPDIEKSRMFCEFLDCEHERLAEVGRLIVHPEFRRFGVSGLLTKRCIRDSVTSGHVPVASALESAWASQSMMLKFGWQIIGSVMGRRAKRPIVLLTPPQKLVDAALSKPLEI